MYCLSYCVMHACIEFKVAGNSFQDLEFDGSIG